MVRARSGPDLGGPVRRADVPGWSGVSEPREEPEVVDGEVVEARRVPAPVEPQPGRSLLPVAPVAVQAAAVAATGFVAGAATLAVARRAKGRRSTKRSLRRPASKGGRPVVASRSFLVDVHLLGRE